ncbi:MAG: carboxypeptidase-like regulatory domain-containing protein [Candidatus Caenarcaniphilales bacterium]|nr:carboxypeptidase-like regulatory domain-containing protein [Candidatus Caenarcaniphilales bacterium]
MKSHCDDITAFLFSIFFIGWTLLICGFALPSGAENIEKDLILCNIVLNKKLSYNSEIYILNDKIYVPVKQIAQITEEVIEFDRINKTIKFESKRDHLPVDLNGINQTIKIGEATLDKTTNFIYWIQQGFALQDDVLIEKALLESFLDIKLEYDEVNSFVHVTVNRPLKAFKQEKFFGDNPEDKILSPKTQKLNVRSMQVNITSIGNAINAPTQSSDPFTFGNQMNFYLLGDAYGGTYRVGPSIFLQPNGDLGFGGLQSSWSKKIKDNWGVVLGDSNPQLDPINFPSGAVLGARIGSPDKINLSLSDGFSFQGKCEPNSEILLFFNQQVIARQICKTGNYNFLNIPRLTGTNNFYKVIQNNTDGTQITLRESQYSFFDDLLQKNEKRWEAFVGRPSFTNSIFLNSSSEQDLSQNNKALTGGFFKYGISPRVNIQAAVSADRNVSTPSESELFFTGKLKPNFADIRFLEGQTASLGIISRPRDNLGLNFFGAVSNSKDLTENKLFRSGAGYALLGSLDYRFKNLYTQASAYRYSPSYYTPLNTFSNREGYNFSLGYSLKNQSISLNLRGENTNLDGLSFGGKTKNTNLLVSHNARLGKKTNISNFVNIGTIQNQIIDSENRNARSTIRHRLNKRLDLTFSAGYTEFKDNLSGTSDRITDLTPGFTFYMGEKQEHQLSFSSSRFSDKSNNQFVQGRFTIRDNIVYQPSINRFKSFGGDTSYLFANGLFWEKQSGLRFGLEHLYNVAVPALGGKKISNQSLRVSALFNLGFVDKKPYLMSSPDSGYLVANVFVDSNQNGIKEPGETSIKDAQLVFKDKNLPVGANGQLVLKDIPSGIYEMFLDPLSLPFALIPVNQTYKFRIESGRMTELNFTTKLSGGSVSGNLLIYGLDKSPVSSENVVVVAVNKEGKEVAYTYVNRRNQYTLSELSPGEYSIKVDDLDIEKRNYNLETNLIKVVIPEKLDELTEMEDIDFKGTQTIFKEQANP